MMAAGRGAWRQWLGWDTVTIRCCSPTAAVKSLRVLAWVTLLPVGKVKWTDLEGGTVSRTECWIRCCQWGEKGGSKVGGWQCHSLNGKYWVGRTVGVEELSLIKKFVFQLYWDTTSIQRCINLRCTVCWFGTLICCKMTASVAKTASHYINTISLLW